MAEPVRASEETPAPRFAERPTEPIVRPDGTRAKRVGMRCLAAFDRRAESGNVRLALGLETARGERVRGGASVVAVLPEGR